MANLPVRKPEFLDKVAYEGSHIIQEFKDVFPEIRTNNININDMRLMLSGDKIPVYSTKRRFTLWERTDIENGKLNRQNVATKNANRIARQGRKTIMKDIHNTVMKDIGHLFKQQTS